MSFRRIQSRAVNHHVFLDNRLTNFVGEHVHHGDLIVERDEIVKGNLTVNHDLRAHNFYASGNYYLNNFILIPAGTIIQSAAINIPDGWLNCDGASCHKIIFPDLFDAIGYAYTDLSFITTNFFNLPDMRGRVGIGAGQGANLTNRVMAESGGAETHTLTISEMPNHNHKSNAVGTTIGLMTSDGQNTASSGLDLSTGEPNLYASLQALAIHNTGLGNAHNNIQPFLVIRHLIKY